MLLADLGDRPAARSRSSGGCLRAEPPDMTPTFPRTGVSGLAGAVQSARCEPLSAAPAGAALRFWHELGNPLGIQ
jgi:hypothetical protein